MKKQERFITIEDNIKLWVETYGNSENTACLFISGAGANSSFWSESLCNKLVENDFFVIKYDHRDIGYSSKIDFDKNPYNVMRLAKDALSILDSLKIEKAHIIGHSMGGFIAQLLVIHYPERIKTMISASASTNSPKVPLPPEKTWKIFVENNPQNDFENDLKGFMPVWKFLNGTAEFDEKLAIEYTQNLYKRQDIIGALGENHVKAQASLTDRTEKLKKVRIPTLIIHGEEDYLVEKSGGIQTAECIENAKLVLIPKMGHLPFNREIQKKFENEIIEFINN
jgi:pimeloyl-ACP methyl ester carboxylesterase